MKVLIVADGLGKIYAESFYNSFKKKGVDVKKFYWRDVFYKGEASDIGVLDRIQNKFIIGPKINKINNSLLEEIDAFRPDLVFLYKGTHIYRETVRAIKLDYKCKVFSYNNDDAFSKKWPKYFWRHFKSHIDLCDHSFYYREKNRSDLAQLGATSLSLLRSYYIEEENYNITNSNIVNYSCDVIFIGHFEDDGRDEIVLNLLKSGVDLKVFGPEWERSSLYDDIIAYTGNIKPITKDYNLALNSAKIALVFLSKINNDTYTRRCFEITIAGTLMLSEYSDDLNSLFKEDIEAVYFRRSDEIKSKIDYLLESKSKIQIIATNGMNRCKLDGHSSDCRVEQIISVYEKLS